MLEMSCLRVMVKRSRGKKQEEETEKQYVIVNENSLFKSFATNNVRNYDRGSPTSLTMTVDSAEVLPAMNFPQREEYHAKLFLNLPDYF